MANIRGGKGLQGLKGPKIYSNQKQTGGRFEESKSFEELVERVIERFEDFSQLISDENKEEFLEFLQNDKLHILVSSKVLKIAEQKIMLEKAQNKIEKLQQQAGMKKSQIRGNRNTTQTSI
jgi:hypothetical protein